MDSSLKGYLIKRIELFLNNSAIETNKFEFKRQWYDFRMRNEANVEIGKQEFSKDVCALLNTSGQEDRFIVIGVSEDKRLYPSRVEDSGMNQAEVSDILKASLDPPIVIDIDYVNVRERQLTVIHVPSPLSKPYFVKNHISAKGHPRENVIFVRSGSSTRIAGKNDVETMLLERNGDFPKDRLVECTITRNEFVFKAISYGANALAEVTIDASETI